MAAWCCNFPIMAQSVRKHEPQSSYKGCVKRSWFGCPGLFDRAEDLGDKMSATVIFRRQIFIAWGTNIRSNFNVWSYKCIRKHCKYSSQHMSRSSALNQWEKTLHMYDLPLLNDTFLTVRADVCSSFTVVFHTSSNLVVGQTTYLRIMLLCAIPYSDWSI